MNSLDFRHDPPLDQEISKDDPRHHPEGMLKATWEKNGGPFKHHLSSSPTETSWGLKSDSPWEQELEKRSVNAVYAHGLVIDTHQAILYFRSLLDAHDKYAERRGIERALEAVEKGVPQPRWDVPDAGSVMPDDPALASDQTLIYAKRKALNAIKALIPADPAV